MKTYTQDDIDACRARLDADLEAYRKLVGKAPFSGKVMGDRVNSRPLRYIGWATAAIMTAASVGMFATGFQ